MSEEKTRNTWAWVYGDECQFLWNHFGIKPSSRFDRMKIQFLDYETEEEQEEDE